MDGLANLLLAAAVLWQIHRLSAPNARTSLLARLLQAWVAICIWRLIGRAM